MLTSSSLVQFVAAICFVCCLLCYPLVEAQVRVLEPASLAAYYNPPRIQGSTAPYGAPYYGEQITGELVFFDKMGCKPEDYTQEEAKEGSAQAKKPAMSIFMVARGDCLFSTKARLAEDAGAIALIISDTAGSKSTSRDIQRIIITRGTDEGPKRIPSILISDMDAQPIVTAAKNDEDVVLSLAWNIRQKEHVKMDIWLSPGMSDRLEFIADFKESAEALNSRLDFNPHYIITQLRSYYNTHCVDGKGELCAMQPDWSININGREVVEESARQLCIWAEYKDGDIEKESSSSYYSQHWWDYVAEFYRKCAVETLQPPLKTCSEAAMKKVNIDPVKIQDCYEKEHLQLLRQEQIDEAWSSSSLIINEWWYKGPLESETVLRATCSAFKSPPDECGKLGKHTFGVDDTEARGSHVAVIIVFSVIGISFITMMLFWVGKKYFKWSFRYFRMDQNDANQVIDIASAPQTFKTNYITQV